MSKKDNFWDNPFGGMFDFNGDGKEDLSEQWIAMKIFEECLKDDERKNKAKASKNNIIDLDDLDIEGI